MTDFSMFKFINKSINFSKFNLLIIGSDELTDKIDNLFKDFGFNIYRDSTIDKANKTIKDNEIEYVILDAEIINNSDIIKLLSLNDIKVVILTKNIDTEFQKTCYKKGAIDFIFKDKNLMNKILDIPKIIQRIKKNSTENIVIINNNCSFISEMNSVLKKRNFNIDYLNDYHHIIEKINNGSKIDLIIFDLDRENFNVYDFVTLHKDLLFKDNNINIVVLSEDSSPLIIRDFLRLGVKDVIKKPLLIEEFIYKIEFIINNKNIEDRLVCKTKLLVQYKDTVDQSAIVSKTDNKGLITYVNDSFCEISGYSRSELIGKSHRILKHPDTDPKMFADLWHHIKKLKTPWTGTLKNKKKNGDTYWVQAIINPILDDNEDVIEYISIRNDITEMERTKEELKEKYSFSETNAQEYIKISKLYEEAINQSNIILRFNKNKIITYANKEFYKLSGFQKSELINKHYDFLDRTNKEDSDKMWKHITSCKTWKGQISSIFKDNKIFHFAATVVPITNSNNEITEFLSIKKDITEVLELHKEIDSTQKEIIYKMGEIGESRSNETGNHVKRVANYSKLLAELSGLSEKECDILFIASPMHDIGKVAIPDHILNKPGKLTKEEWEVMKTHCTAGYNVLKNSKIDVLKAASIVAMQHHEKYDGSGYPSRLKGKDIHIYGRITALADVFDALGSDRCYKKAWKDEDIFRLLRKESGKHFDPRLIQLFFDNLDLFLKIRDKYIDEFENH